MLADVTGDRKSFWRRVRRLGRGAVNVNVNVNVNAVNVKPVIPMEVMDDQGLIHRDHETVQIGNGRTTFLVY